MFVCQQVREQKRELVTESVTPAVCVSKFLFLFSFEISQNVIVVFCGSRIFICVHLHGDSTCTNSHAYVHVGVHAYVCSDLLQPLKVYF